MAMFEGRNKNVGSRSNTHLVLSGHASPAQKYLLDRTFLADSMKTVTPGGVLFEYAYGGARQTEVTIPKGRFVSAGKSIEDLTTGKFYPVLTLPGMVNVKHGIGMVPYNITKDYLQDDKFGGNQPSIITQEYVELPYMPGVAASTDYSITGVVDEENRISKNLKMPWGAVIGMDVKINDYVKTTPSGRLTKWDPTADGFHEIVGQVIGEDLNQTPFGWLEWALRDEATVGGGSTFANNVGASNTLGGSYPYDAEIKEFPQIDEGVLGNSLTNPTGLSGIHDGSGNFPGYGKNDTVYADMKLGFVPSGVADNTIMAFQAKDYAGGKMINVIESTVEVKIDGTVIAPERFNVNEKEGIINITLTAANSSKEVTATYQAKHYGTHGSLDFKGVVGSLKVLLQK